jgi:hypothetical protein
MHHQISNNHHTAELYKSKLLKSKSYESRLNDEGDQEVESVNSTLKSEDRPNEKVFYTFYDNNLNTILHDNNNNNYSTNINLSIFDQSLNYNNNSADLKNEDDELNHKKIIVTSIAPVPDKNKSSTTMRPMSYQAPRSSTGEENM